MSKPLTMAERKLAAFSLVTHCACCGDLLPHMKRMALTRPDWTPPSHFVDGDALDRDGICECSGRHGR